MPASAAEISQEFAALGSAKIAEHSGRFFKSGAGEYGEGDQFRGIRVPVVRQQVKRFKNASLRTLLALLKSPWHEDRLFAVLSMVDRYQRGDASTQKRVYEEYLKHAAYVNNWDLVDSSAHLIVGPWLESRSRRKLHTLARSTMLWERRIAIMATYHYIRAGDFAETLVIAKRLLRDEHDLIHKAVGWMLREVGNRDRSVETQYLRQHYKAMPRTMLRYAIEKYPETERKAWLNGTF